jgi:C4-dicarboxylate transporter DctM subunit
LLLIVIGVPIAFAMGLSALIVIVLLGDIPLGVIPEKLVYTTDSFVFLAVPFFILAGEIMEKGGISSRLIRFAKTLVGQIRGGLAMVSVVASIIFAGLSGSAVADASAIGSVLIPAMKKQGYKKEFVVSLQSSSAILGPIIPPSVLMILYGSITDLSIGKLFLAGVVPGILIGGALMLASYGYAVKSNYPAEKNASFREFIESFGESVPAIVFPGIILFGILFGVFTPTEAGAVAVFYALFVALFVYREVKVSDLKGIFISASLKTAAVMIVVAMASVLAWILALEKAPAALVSHLSNLSEEPIVVLFLLIIALVLIGTVIDTIAATIILAPILAPLAQQYGFDPIHFGLIVIMSLVIGLMTPPVGVVLYITCGIGDVKIHHATKYVFGFVLIMVLTIFVIAALPQLVMFLPDLYAVQ